MDCECGKPDHEPGCAELVAGADASAQAPNRARKALERSISELLDRVEASGGPGAAYEFGIKILLAREPWLRAHRPPDHPALQLIDEWRAEQRGG